MDTTALRPARAARPGRALTVAAVRALRSHPRLTLSTLAWLLGLFVAFWAAPLTSATPAATAAYAASLDRAAALAPPLAAARRKAYAASEAASAEAGWFGRWSRDERKRERVAAARAAASSAAARVAALEAEAGTHLRAARSALGLWSEAGLAEARATFASAFRRGRLLGKRQTLWDGAWRILGGLGGGRDAESAHPAVALLELALITFVNFFTGMLLALVQFTWALPGLAWSYSPGILSGLLFCGVALLGAISVVTGFLALVAGGGAAVVAGAVALTAPPGRLRGGGGGGGARISTLPAPPRPRAPAEVGGWAHHQAGGGGERPHGE
jgi:hypothetical protein